MEEVQSPQVLPFQIPLAAIEIYQRKGLLVMLAAMAFLQTLFITKEPALVIKEELKYLS